MDVAKAIKLMIKNYGILHHTVATSFPWRIFAALNSVIEMMTEIPRSFQNALVAAVGVPMNSRKDKGQDLVISYSFLFDTATVIELQLVTGDLWHNMVHIYEYKERRT